MTNITKETLTELWCKSCQNSEDPEDFNFFGSSEQPGFGIRINNKISLTIEAIHETKCYSIQLIFSNIVRYKSLSIEEVEYMSFLDYWETSRNKASKIVREKLIADGLEEFSKLINNK